MLMFGPNNKQAGGEERNFKNKLKVGVILFSAYLQEAVPGAGADSQALLCLSALAYLLIPTTTA